MQPDADGVMHICVIAYGFNWLQNQNTNYGANWVKKVVLVHIMLHLKICIYWENPAVEINGTLFDDI